MLKLHNKGFTLLEVMLVLAFFSLLVGMSVPIVRTFQTENNINLTTSTIIQVCRRTALLSQGMLYDSNWGVNLTTGKATIFKGESFASRDISYDEYFDLPTNINIEGLTEIIFSPLNGLPQNTGTIIVLAPESLPKEININAWGTIDH